MKEALSSHLFLARSFALLSCMTISFFSKTGHEPVPTWMPLSFLCYGVLSYLLLKKLPTLNFDPVLWSCDIAFAMVLVMYTGGPSSPFLFLFYLFLGSCLFFEPKSWCWVGALLLIVFSLFFTLPPPIAPFRLYHPVPLGVFLAYAFSFLLTSTGVWLFAPQKTPPPSQFSRKILLEEVEKAYQVSRQQASLAEKTLQEYTRKARELSSLHEVSTRTTSSLDPYQIMEVTATKTRQEMNAQVVFLMLVEGRELRVAHAQELSERTREAFHCDISTPPFSIVLKESRPLRLKRDDPGFTGLLAAQEHFRDLLFVPLKSPRKTQPFGILAVANSLNPEGFTERQEEYLMTMAAQAAVALENATLHQELKRAYLDTIMRLSMAAEYRDDDTATHLMRASSYSAIIARHLGLSPSDVEIIKYASPMHDIGKIGIPDAILMKPGKFTPDEFEEMKRHSLIGATILANADSPLLNTSAAIALTHHEKYDGTGYPKGLKGEEIPLAGRIVALADVFDALMSKRVYREALPIEQVLKFIKESSGMHFDPRVVEAFFSGLDEILTISRETRKR